MLFACLSQRLVWYRSVGRDEEGEEMYEAWTGLRRVKWRMNAATLVWWYQSFELRVPDELLRALRPVEIVAMPQMGHSELWWRVTHRDGTVREVWPISVVALCMATGYPVPEQLRDLVSSEQRYEHARATLDRLC